MYSTVWTSSYELILSWMFPWWGTHLLECLPGRWRLYTVGWAVSWCAWIQDTPTVGAQAWMTRCLCFCTGLWYIGQLFVVSSQVSWWVLFDVGSKQMSNIPSLSAPCWSRRWLLCPRYKTEGCVSRNPACCWPSWRSCQWVSSKIELSEGQPLDISLSLQSRGCVLSACMGIWWEIFLWRHSEHYTSEDGPPCPTWLPTLPKHQGLVAGLRNHCGRRLVHKQYSHRQTGEYSRILSGRSLINSRKSRGPSTEPCGTPLTTGTLSDYNPSTTTLWVLPRSKDVIHWWVFPLMP